MYEIGNNVSSSLDKLTNVYLYYPNEKGEGVHYTPLWMEDGKYTVFVYSGIIKTPGGNITALSESNPIYINSNLYTDWHIGGNS